MATKNKTTSLDLVKKIVEELLKHLSCKSEVEVKLIPLDRGRSQITIMIKSEDSNHLIGQHGANLMSLQHLTRMLISAKTGRPCFAKVDVNDYKSKREEQVVLLAKEAAEKALRTDNMVILRPMTGFERRIVHITLKDEKALTTESLGQEPNRRVVVKPLHESRVVKSIQDKGLTLDDIKV